MVALACGWWVSLHVLAAVLRIAWLGGCFWVVSAWWVCLILLCGVGGVFLVFVLLNSGFGAAFIWVSGFFCGVAGVAAGCFFVFVGWFVCVGWVVCLCRFPVLLDLGFG